MSLITPNRRLLVVDDDPDLLDLLETIVRQLGFDCDTANNGAVALTLLKKKRYPLVITDIQMPVMNGAELLAKVRRLYPDTAVIVISGYFDDGDGPEMIKAGAFDFMTKPFLPNDLENVIIRCLRSRGELVPPRRR